MDVPTPEELRLILALRMLTHDQRQALTDTILTLAAGKPQQERIARLAAIFEFKRPA